MYHYLSNYNSIKKLSLIREKWPILSVLVVFSKIVAIVSF